MTHSTLTVTLTLRGPLLTRDSGPAKFGFDAALARDAQGRHCIPHSLVKGRLREALAELHVAAPDSFKCDLDDLFGANTRSAEKGEPVATGGNPAHRGRLAFTDFLLTSDAQAARSARHRIKIDSALGSVEKGALFAAEDVFGSGATIVAKGNISFFSSETVKPEDIAREIELGLRWIAQLGAGHTTGFGRLCDVAVAPEHRDIEITPSTAPVALALEIRPHAPFCFAQHKIGGNLFESQPFIPGNAIKGALAEMCRAAGRALPAHFDALRVRHAFPSAAGERARVAPLSIVAVKMKVADGKAVERQFDIAAHENAILLRGAHGPTAPAFRVDWKGPAYAACDAAFGWKQPGTTLRVRTAMDSARRKSADGQLFSQELTVPGDIAWRGVIDLSAITDNEERANVAAELRALLGAGLRYLGKTKATATVTPTDMPESPSPEIAKTCRITMQTPALLADPRFQNGTLHDCYSAAWKELSGESLALSHFFAAQSLAGGNFLWQRFQKSSLKPAYRPWLLTDAGSVFILDVKGEDAAPAKIADWLAHGLGLPKWARDEFTDDWKFNPYIRQNGFGEIAIDITGTGIAEPTTEEIIHA